MVFSSLVARQVDYAVRTGPHHRSERGKNPVVGRTLPEHAYEICAVSLMLWR